MGNLFIIISVGLNVLGQFAMKAGVNELGSLTLATVGKAFIHGKVLLGLLSYAVGSIFWILALSHKDLSYAYPMLSVGYLVIVLGSWVILGENFNVYRLVGVVLITLGILFVFRS